ncbi:MAG: cob(I)yrinic acid a,c-diamide adenosyltransferase [Lachnospiraceae bacterium]|nr:cob(I)yrinic acid a,c-diamide adenosyltransferase [Lachnospiraceae bacterium]
MDKKKPRKGTGLVHIYCGDGKGKTTTGMGLCIRAAGHGCRVLIYQFMKNNKTSERKVLEQIEQITLLDGLEEEKFSFQLTEEERYNRKKFYNRQLEKVTEMAAEQDYDVLFLDEAVYAVRAGLLDEDALVKFLQNKPDKLEVILTGQEPGERLVAEADYVSEIRKIKHPFDWKQPARDGIER